MQPIDGILISTTTPGQSGPESNGNETFPKAIELKSHHYCWVGESSLQSAYSAALSELIIEIVQVQITIYRVEQ